MAESIDYTNGAAELVEQSLEEYRQLHQQSGPESRTPESFDDYQAEHQLPFTD